MVETKSPGDKTLSVQTKTLTLKPRVETGTVRQSFSHGRTKQVVVEKRGKRRIGGDAPAAETAAAPEPVAKAAPKAPLARTPTPAAPPRSNVVLRTLTEDERSARASALADAKQRDIEERRLADEEARRRNSREGIEQAEREAAEARRKAEEERHRQDEEAKRNAEAGARKGGGGGQKEVCRSRSPRCNAGARPARRPRARYCRRRQRRRRGSAPGPPRPGRRRPPRRAAQNHREARPAEAARSPDAGHRAQRRRRARA